MRPIGIVTMIPVYCAAAACSSGSGAGGGQSLREGREGPKGRHLGPEGAASARIHSDAQVVGLLLSADADAIAGAKLALGTADGVDDDAPSGTERFGSVAVRAFATMMVGNHSLSSTVVHSFGIAPEASVDQRALQSAAEATKGNLLDLAGWAFDVLYLQSQVATCVTLCSLVREKLLPAASNPRLKAYLETQFLPTIESHLDAATSILARLNNEGAPETADLEP
jgi:putative membrane protein